MLAVRDCCRLAVDLNGRACYVSGMPTRLLSKRSTELRHEPALEEVDPFYAELEGRLRAISERQEQDFEALAEALNTLSQQMEVLHRDFEEIRKLAPSVGETGTLARPAVHPLDAIVEAGKPRSFADQTRLAATKTISAGRLF